MPATHPALTFIIIRASMLKADELDSKSGCARFDSSGVRQKKLRPCSPNGYKDTGLSIPLPGFDSPQGYHIPASGRYTLKV